MNLSELSIEELNKVIADASRLIRKKEFEARELRKSKALSDLNVGDIVSVTGKKFTGEIFEVLKLNPKKVQCKRENGEVWNIPYCHILIS